MKIEVDLDKLYKVFATYAVYYHPRKQKNVCVMTKSQFCKAIGVEVDVTDNE